MLFIVPEIYYVYMNKGKEEKPFTLLNHKIEFLKAKREGENQLHFFLLRIIAKKKSPEGSRSV